ncbi:hypothetical protein SLEP1_g58619 [Rubroshorea leprosula]|uniref:Water stress and hypersensitive response domain-containing protein n=1 Tax=Rubroshorea leprosula TaxID=152421 RepID=A0AAV5MQB0_9ROSI|nr:hypothetical protein SLEP1_g58619 [Rubroshorea leprosula]
MLPMDRAGNFVPEIVAKATLTDVNVKKFSREEVELNAKVSVNNPYGYPLPICDFSYELKSAGRAIVSGYMLPDPGLLKASNTTMLMVSVKVPYSILVSLIGDIGADRNIDYELEVGLTIIDIPIISDLRINLSTKGKLKLPTFPSHLPSSTGPVGSGSLSPSSSPSAPMTGTEIPAEIFNGGRFCSI